MDIAKLRKKVKEAKKSGPAKKPGKKKTRPGKKPEKESLLIKTSHETDRLKGVSGGKGETEKVDARDEQSLVPHQASEFSVLESLIIEPALPDEKENHEPEVIVELLKFRLFDEDYAIKTDGIVEILRPQRITAVPRIESHARGIISYRGKIIPVVDISRRLFDDPDNDVLDEKANIVIIRGARDLIGILIDSAMEVVEVTENSLMPPPMHLSAEESRLIEHVVGMDKGFLTVVRIEELIGFKVNVEA